MARSQSKAGEGRCNKVLKAIGDYWTLAIIGVLGQGERRFCEIERSVDGINPVTLTDRLKKMEKIGFVDRTEAPQSRCVTYSLSTRGRELLPITSSIQRFAEGFKVSSGK
jgi:DNA-binding HxlR family transcriptional regulator